MTQENNFMVPTADRPFVSVEGLAGVAIKHMHTLPTPSVWSAVIKVDAGEALPSRRTHGFCELLVVSGEGRTADNAEVGKGDYLREESSSYAPIEAVKDLVLFVIHHGSWEFLGEGAVVLPPVA